MIVAGERQPREIMQASLPPCMERDAVLCECEKTRDSVSNDVRGRDVSKVFLPANTAKKHAVSVFESGEARVILRKRAAKGLSCRNLVVYCARRREKRLSSRSPRESCH